jgi:hypothetical protein
MPAQNFMVTSRGDGRTMANSATPARAAAPNTVKTEPSLDFGIGDGLRDRGTQAVCRDRLKTG